jgi:hypothetical protein
MQFDGPLDGVEKLPSAERAPPSAAARSRDLSASAVLANHDEQATSNGSQQPGQADGLGEDSLPYPTASTPGASTDAEYVPGARPSVADPAGMVSPARWMLSSSGGVERSRDDGHSWETVRVAGDLRFRALSVQGAEVWVGGPGGVLYHSNDSGQRWAQVIPRSHGESLNGEIARIDFADPQNGTLTTAAGQSWTTSDSGRSWKKR